MVFNFLKNLSKGNLLYYPGCLSRFVATDIADNYRKILKDKGFEYIELEGEEVCCGSPVLKAGYRKDFEVLARKNLSVFEEYGVKTIVTSCPACSFILGVKYREILGDEWSLEVKHIVELLVDGSSDSKKSETFGTGKKNCGSVTYHDPCHLGKQRGIYEQPRFLIQEAGYRIKEMDFSGKNSFCCGGGGGLKSNNKELSNKIAQKRLEQARETGVDKLVTCCPLCYLHFRENAKKLKILELSEIII